MVRNYDIQNIFEIADDSLQGVLGYHFYVVALSVANTHVDPSQFRLQLPNIAGVDVFPHTFSWVRYYTKDDLINTFLPPFFEIYQSRISLTAITNIFEDSLDNFITKLKSKSHPPYINGRKLGDRISYKKRIEWAFFESQKCTIGDLEAIARLPKTFGIIDEARVLRNLIVHNHGIFTERYEKDKINSEKIEKSSHPDYPKYKDTGENVPIIINYEDITNFSRAHIEVLHILHNQIQKEYFEHPEPYDYRREEKNIGWDLAFWGNAKKDYVKDNILRKSYLKV